MRPDTERPTHGYKAYENYEKEGIMGGLPEYLSRQDLCSTHASNCTLYKNEINL